jgi:uroporphyrinogen-III decarboxylase
MAEELLDRFMQWEQVRLDILLDAGVDVITYRAWYESTDFWGVQSWRRFIKPRLKEIVDQVHQAGAKFSYILTTGLKARANDLAEVGIDTLWGVDPVQDLTADLPYLKRQIGDSVCLLGGVNSTVTLVNGTEEEIRREVRYACETLGPGGGFILAPIDNIYDYTPRRNIEVLVDEWRKMREYPA